MLKRWGKPIYSHCWLVYMKKLMGSIFTKALLAHNCFTIFIKTHFKKTSRDAAPSCFSISTQRTLTKGQMVAGGVDAHPHLAPTPPNLTRLPHSGLWLCYENFSSSALKFILRHLTGIFSNFLSSCIAIVFPLQINSISWNYHSKWWTISFPFNYCCSDVQNELPPYYVHTE